MGWDGGEDPPTNGHTEIQYGNETAHQEDDLITSSNEDIGPLATAARKATVLFLQSQKAAEALISACEKHEGERLEYPKLQLRYNKLQKQVQPKDATIKNLKGIIKLKDEESADIKEERRILDAEKQELVRKKGIADDREKVRQAELTLQVEKELEKGWAKQQDELDEKSKTLEKEYMSRMAEQEKSMEEREKDHAEELEKVKNINQKSQTTISGLKKEVAEKSRKLEDVEGNYKILKAAATTFEKQGEESSKELENLKEKFSLQSESVEFFVKEFGKISVDVEKISDQYFSRGLSEEEAEALQQTNISKDSLLFKAPFSDSKESALLRTAYAREVISTALRNTIWQPFSSDKLAPLSASSKLLVDLEAAVRKSDDGESSEAAEFWKAQTIRALVSLSSSSTDRADTVVDSVVKDLDQLLDPAGLNPFKGELSQIAKAAIFVWAKAEADSHDFIIEPNLDQKNKALWAPAPLSDASVPKTPAVSGKTGPGKVFTLFPIILCEKRIPAPKQLHAPGGFPEEPQPLEVERSTVLHGIGLAEDSSLVRRGVEEKEEIRKEEAEEAAAVAETRRKTRERRRQRGRNDSMDSTALSPTSPTQTWRSSTGSTQFD